MESCTSVEIETGDPCNASIDRPGAASLAPAAARDRIIAFRVYQRARRLPGTGRVSEQPTRFAFFIELAAERLAATGTSEDDKA